MKQMTSGRKASLFAIVLFAVAPTLFAAQSLSRPMEVQAEVISNCRLTLEPLVFGGYDPLVANSSTPLDATSTMMVTCTRDTRATIMIDQGQNPVGSTRSLAFTDQRLKYQLFRDSARTQVWGTGADAYAYTSSGAGDLLLKVFARIPPGQAVAAGKYADVVTATVDF